MNLEKVNFYHFALVQITALSLAMLDCATQSTSIGLGGAIGAGTGAVPNEYFGKTHLTRRASSMKINRESGPNI